MLCEAIDSRFDIQQKIMDSCFDQWDRKIDEISDEIRVMDQHVTSLKYDQQTRRLASARSAPPQQYKRCVGIVFLHARVEPGPKTSTRPACCSLLPKGR